MSTDQLTICPKCNCDGCYKLPVNETRYSYYCWGCGFQSNDLMKEGEFDIDAYEETLPELYKDLKYVDSEDRVWYPIAINLPTKGTVFIHGNTKDNWQWAGIKSKKLTKKELLEPKYKDSTHKSNAKSLKHFEKDFIEACDYIGLFKG